MCLDGYNICLSFEELIASSGRDYYSCLDFDLQSTLQTLEIPEDSIEDSSVNEEYWRCSVHLLIENDGDHSWLVEASTAAICTTTGHRVKTVTRTDIEREVKEHRPAQIMGHKDLIYEQAKRYFTSYDREMPSDLIAKLIKYYIVSLKCEDKLIKGAKINKAVQNIAENKEEIEESKQKTNKDSFIMKSRVKSKIEDKGKEPTKDELNPDKKTINKSNEQSTGNIKSAPKEKSPKRDTTASQDTENKIIQAEKKRHVRTPKASITPRGSAGQGKEDNIETIDQGPTDGPQLYMVVSGFYDANLPMELIKLGVPLISIIRLKEENSDTLGNNTHSNKESMISDKSDNCENTLRGPRRKSTKVKGKYKERLTSGTSKNSYKAVDTWQYNQISSFWTQFGKQFESVETALATNDIAMVELMVQNHSKLNVIKNITNTILNELLGTIYEIEILRQHHSCYLRSFNIQPIVTVTKTLLLDDMNIYSASMDLIPSEKITLPYVLHCIISQVEYMCTEDSLNCNNKQSENSYKPYKDCKSSRDSRYVTIESNNVTPLLITHGDQLNIDFHSYETKSHQIIPSILNILKSGPIFKLWKAYEIINSLEKEKYDYHIDRLLYFVGRQRINNCTLRSYLHVALSKSLSLFATQERNQNSNKLEKSRDIFSSHCKSLIYSKNTSRDLAFEDINFKSKLTSLENPSNVLKSREEILKLFKEFFECSELTSLIGFLHFSNPKHISTKRWLTHEFDRYNHVERMEPHIMVQSVYNAFTSFNDYHHRYYKPTDALVLYFYNRHDHKGLREESWSAQLTTPVGFRDFYRFIVPERKDGIQQEEGKYQEKSVQDKSVMAAIIEEISHETDVKTRSLTVLQNNSEEKETKGDSSKENIDHFENNSKKYIKISTKNKTIDYDKSQLKDVQLENNVNRERTHSTALHDELVYDLAPIRVQVSGTTTKFFSPDGLKVLARSSGWLFNDTHLYIEIDNCGHVLCLNTTAAPVPSLGHPFIFHLITTSGAIIAFERTDPQEIERLTSLSDSKVENNDVTIASHKGAIVGRNNNKININSKNIKSVSNNEPRSEIKKESSMSTSPESPQPPRSVKNESVTPWEPYNLRLSLPCGVSLETVKYCSVMDHFVIKQCHVSTHQTLKEKYRCFLRNGNILKFKYDGTVEILSLNGNIFICESFCRPEPVQKSNIEHIHPPSSLEIITEEGKTPHKEDKYSKDLIDNFKINPRTLLDSKDAPTHTNKLKSTRKTPSSDQSKENNKQKRSEKLNSSKYKRNKGNIENDSSEINHKKSSRQREIQVRPRNNNLEIEVMLDSPPIIKKAPSPQPFHLWEITDFFSIFSWGEQYRTLFSTIIKDKSYLRLKNAVDTQLGEVYLKRSDGTNTLLKNDGTLTVSFPDGSRITSYFVVEINDTFCDWTAEEIRLYRIQTRNENTDNITSMKFECLEEVDNNSKGLVSLHSQEGYVSIQLVTLMEHPDYASVSYSGIMDSCEIKLPDDLEIKIHSNGNYSICLDKKNSLDIKLNSLLLKSRTCDLCLGSSQTTIDLLSYESINQSNNVFCRTNDSCGNTFSICCDGICALDFLYGETGNISSGEEKHERNNDICTHYQPSAKRRCFVLHRDNHGEELIHENDVRQYLNTVESFKGGTVHVYDVSLNQTTRIYNTFHPLKGDFSNRHIMNYQIKSVLPTNLTWLDLKSVPIGTPPKWLHSFPTTISKPCTDTKVLSRTIFDDFTTNDPVILIKRVLQKIELEGESIFEILRTGLNSYKNAADLIFREYLSHSHPDLSISEKVQFQEKLLSVALNPTQSSVVEVHSDT